ncbi:hypothetical protein SAMN05216353_101291 [Halobacillus alkaliphilus]|uniref:Uncharacterized protein n=1 Tax=Halobacillus alkaliphilus TaxID=396056 RepID=A0A1I2JRN2_9BACI|nr:hypothetical protein [Halobacillus alkaliphilus]SFF55426.1 hypothetical protein SAMN05216353_101291 [Halobacillus alkaliphilus]
MKHLNSSLQQQSFHVLSCIHLVKKSKEAYEHAKEIVESGSPISEDICKACAAICRDSAKKLNAAKDGSMDKMIELCLVNATLCEEMINMVKSDK